MFQRCVETTLETAMHVVLPGIRESNWAIGLHGVDISWVLKGLLATPLSLSKALLKPLFLVGVVFMGVVRRAMNIKSIFD